MQLITAVLLALTVASTTTASAQTPGAATKPTMTARLIDAEKKAADGAATVEVTVSGVELTDPAAAKEQPVAGQAHIHYQVDKGPVVATPSAKLSFHELAPGAHTIMVVLAGNDHKPLGPQQQLKVTVPTTAAVSPASHGAAHEAVKPKY